MSGWGHKRTPTIAELRRYLIDDSLERSRALEKLLKLVREDERRKTIADLEAAREKAARDGR